MRSWLWLLVAAGCVERGAVTCPDGRGTCPEGTACVAFDDASTLCIPEEDLATCAALDALASCGTDRRCYDVLGGRVCLASGCGNGFVDPDEVCDDGGNASEDGCAADCRSDETCGNGVVDGYLGEQCDDTNYVSGDGCSSTCRPEQPQWFEQLLVRPMIEDGFATTYDVRRRRLVLFGGSAMGIQGGRRLSSDVVEWNGRGWEQLDTTIHPTGRVGAAIAYDTVRGATVLFGGGFQGDTWELRGGTWNLLDVVGPTGRSDAGLAFDSARQRMVLFGGSNSGGKYESGTWILHAGTWTELPLTPSPPVPLGPSAGRLAFDPGRAVTALLVNGELWELGSAGWQMRGTAPVPDGKLAFDPANRMLMLVGERDGSLHTWGWDGAQWIDRGSSRFAWPYESGLGSDPATGRVYFIGVASALYLAVWNGNGWTDVPEDVTPVGPGDGAGNVVGSSATYDPRRARTILVGPHAATWTFDGTRWTPLDASPFGERLDPAIAFDVARDRAILHGGARITSTGPKIDGETWLLDGDTWTKYDGPGPSPRREHCMVYDPRRDRTVLIGGTDSTETGTLLFYAESTSDAWEWDGTAWTQLTGAPSLPVGATCAYDPVRGKVVVFGGMAAAPDESTWTYDGQWRLEHPPVSPPSRSFPVLSWNANRQRLVMTGGAGFNGIGFFQIIPVGDAWEWDGALWREVPAAVPLRAGYDHVDVPSTRPGITVMGGRSGGGTPHDDKTWELRWHDGSPSETCQGYLDVDGDRVAGCDDPDCWKLCSPLCRPDGATCDPAAPRCGDGVRDSIEPTLACPADYGAVPAVCGDGACGTGEDCLGDCGVPP